MKTTVFVALALALAGCAHADRFVGPHGENMAEIHCGGYARMSDCFAKAREICGGNFELADKREGTVYSQNYYNHTVTPVATRSITVACDGVSIPSQCRGDTDCPNGMRCETQPGLSGRCVGT